MNKVFEISAGVILAIAITMITYGVMESNDIDCEGIVYGKTYNIESGFYAGHKIDTHKQAYLHVYGEVTTKDDVVVGYLNVMCEDLDKGN